MPDQARGGILSPFLQRRRIARALPLLRGHTLDYGCGNGALFAALDPKLRDGYVGYDPDPAVIDLARDLHPDATFTSDPDELHGPFDTIASLAVIEHVPSIPEYLDRLAALLAGDGRIVLTSPRPWGDGVHRLGGRLGLFSREASEEHNEYVTAGSIATYASGAGLELERAGSFLIGANQLFVIRRASGV